MTKIPATNDSLYLLDLGASSINPEVAKHFLFSGTKIVRARRPQDGHDEEAVALAIVVRTGFNTTKGALVRSMLFPRPLGFRFYRDAFRYISVMGVIGGIGFLASFINFVRLGVIAYVPFSFRMQLIRIGGMARDSYPCLGFDHDCCAPSTPGNVVYWNKFRIVSFEEEEYFLYQSSKAGISDSCHIFQFRLITAGSMLEVNLI